MLFRNRRDAGQQLGAALLRYRDDGPVVLALPRGGVVIGDEVARALNAPLDVILVRKIGVPFQPELALGAVVDGDTPETVVNPDVAAMAGLSSGEIAEAAERELRVIERRRQLYLKGRKRPAIAGRCAILVDDGIATGATVRAALRAARRAGPSRLVLAVPVAPADSLTSLAAEADETVCLSQPSDFSAIGVYYNDFSQVEDSEVIALLDTATARTPE
ncbi:MAG: phosphoribosyltransferase [Inquilinaceae bacterium]